MAPPTSDIGGTGADTLYINKYISGRAIVLIWGGA